MKDGHISFHPDRPSNMLDGKIVIAGLGGDHAEKMQRVGMTRLRLENLPIDLLGGLQPTGLMVLDRNRQRLGSRRHNEIMTTQPVRGNVSKKWAFAIAGGGKIRRRPCALA